VPGVASAADALRLQVRHRRVAAAVWGAALAMAVLCGWALATRTVLDTLMLIALAVGGIAVALAAAADWTMFRFVVVADLLLTASVDLLRYVGVGPLTLLGAVTIPILIFSVGFRVTHRAPSDVAASLDGLGWFLGWCFVSLVLHVATLWASQNIAVFMMFVAMAGATATALRADPAMRAVVFRWFDRAVLITVAVYGVSVLIDGLGSDLIIGARSTALFEVLAVARGLSLVRHGDRRRGIAMTVAATVIVLLSLSRTALAVCAILVPLAWLDRRSLSRRAAIVMMVGLTVGVFFFAVVAIKPLSERFHEPDRANIGGVSLSVSGRSAFWAATIRSWKQSPWIGNGPGSSEYLPAQYLPVGSAYSHPHNDYLRVLHDYGAIGAFLWLYGSVHLFREIKKRWRSADTRSDAATAHAAAVLGMTGIALTMLTDNAIVYVFVMLPLSILVGASLSFGRATLREGSASTEGRGGAALSTPPLPINPY
jgi:O-antigen ligase